ncbi:hypothetical protein PhCBS80983_g00144 [Powellomyces hirtus]|uniref:Nitroreductase domain-containing protein n=1 Tax=Powellomyces hirtus TaxID=109895 RepID=A0A507EFF5_9FUNG|nr:hypothetical protein PhCBS80983_g00144 [Powellomyces hirtus]
MPSELSSKIQESVELRRTNYTLSKASPISDERILEIVQHATRHVPSSFNSQSNRAVVLLNANHTKLWDITTEVLKAIVPAENFPATEARLNGFANSYGTVLFFEDETDVKAMQTSFPLYQDRFPIWSQHSSGMLQYVIWTQFAAEGLGANLQHYNPLIDERVRAEWNIPATWQLVAQMPFGTPTAPAGEKTFKPIEDLVKLHK